MNQVKLPHFCTKFKKESTFHHSDHLVLHFLHVGEDEGDNEDDKT